MNCPKKVIRDTYVKIRLYVRTTTGLNLPELGFLLGLPLARLHPLDIQKLVYEDIRDKEKYRISLINELLDIQHGIYNYCMLTAKNASLTNKSNNNDKSMFKE